MSRPILFALIAPGLIMVSCIIFTVDIGAAADADGDMSRIGAEAFLKTGTGARAAGIGGAFIAIADDASATYWNPAGLAQLRKYEFHTSVAQASWSGQSNLSGVFKGRWSDFGRPTEASGYGESSFANNHYFHSFAYPSRPVAIGFDFIFSGINDIEIRKDRTTVEGSFDNSNWAASLSLAYKLYHGVFGTVFLGVRGSLLHQSFSGIDAAWGHTISCGMIYVPESEFWRTGMTIRNLYGNMKWRTQPSDDNRLTPTANFALVLPFQLFSQDISWGANIEMERNRNPESDRSFHQRIDTGIELRFLNSLFLRSGLIDLYTDPETEQPLEASFGVGFMINPFARACKFDYAVVLHEAGARHLFSFGLGL